MSAVSNTFLRSDYWTIRIHNIIDCMLPTNTTEEELEGCNIFLSVCKPLGSSVCPDYPNSTTCQVVTTIHGDTYYYDMGTYSEKEFSPLSGKCHMHNIGSVLVCQDSWGSLSPPVPGYNKNYLALFTFPPPLSPPSPLLRCLWPHKGKATQG